MGAVMGTGFNYGSTVEVVGSNGVDQQLRLLCQFVQVITAQCRDFDVCRFC